MPSMRGTRVMIPLGLAMNSMLYITRTGLPGVSKVSSRPEITVPVIPPVGQPNVGGSITFGTWPTFCASVVGAPNGNRATRRVANARAKRRIIMLLSSGTREAPSSEWICHADDGYVHHQQQ